SKGFEKTDVLIEKSVKAAFDVMDTTPLESIFDLGKFIWKEKFQN
ncbi:MAG: TetR/AcrR family transcriptional regulator, partial [Flavobacterium sp.]